MKNCKLDLISTHLLLNPCLKKRVYFKGCKNQFNKNIFLALTRSNGKLEIFVFLKEANKDIYLH